MGIIDVIFVAACLMGAGLIFISIKKGAPYLPMHKTAIDIIVADAGSRPVSQAADLGSGDGRIIIALAEAGIEAHGYEINPLLVLLSKLRLKRRGLSAKGHIYGADFWRQDLSPYDYIVVFGISGIMQDLEKKLLKEIPAGAIVASYAFTFPTWQPFQSVGQVSFYKKDNF